MDHPDPYAPPASTPPPHVPKVPTTRAQTIATYVSTILGCGSGPYVFKAAGFTNFPDFRASHYIIIFCYAAGAMTIARLVTLKLLALVPGTADKQSR